MKKILAGVILALGFGTLGLLAAQTQTIPANQVPSLGELARKLRAERKEQGTKPMKVFTNDNIPKTGSLSEVGAPAPAGGETAGKAAANGSAGAHDETYFTNRAKEIRSRLDMHQRELNVLQQKLSQGQVNYYPNPQTTLEQTSGPTMNSDVQKLQQQIQAKQDQIAADQKAMQDLTDELRRDGGDPGWIR